MRVNLGVVTMARAGSVRRLPVQPVPVPRPTLTVYRPRAPTNGATAPKTPTLPQRAAGTMEMLASRAGLLQDPGVTYETQEGSAPAGGAPFMTINKTEAPKKESGALLPLAAVAAYFLLG